jgi:class 3 adenylate cyclase
MADNPHQFHIGIRTKLSIFIAFFLITIIALVSYINLRQQYSSLTESFDREIRPLWNYTEKIVIDFQNYSESFIIVEEFRMRLKNKAKELKQYKRQSVKVEKRSWFKKSVVGKLNVFKEGLVDTKNIVKVRYLDTFFSSYLTEKRIKEIENKIKSMMRDSNGREISDHKFKMLQGYARQIALNKEAVFELKNQIAEKTSEGRNSGQDIGSEEADINANSETAELHKKLAENEETLNRNVLKLNEEVLKFFYDSQKEKIMELGLNMDRIRIQSFNTIESPASFDTKIFAGTTSMNSDKFLENSEIIKDWDQRIKKLTFASLVNLDATPKGVQIEDGEYDIFFRPILKKPAVYNRAILILEEIRTKKNDELWNTFFTMDEKYTKEFAMLSEKIRERLTILKEKKSLPSKDKEFKFLYGSYADLIKKREELVYPIRERLTSSLNTLKDRESELNLQISQLQNQITILAAQVENEADPVKKDAASKQLDIQKAGLNDLNWALTAVKREMDNWSNSPEKKIVDALFYLRDAALYEYAIFRFSNKVDPYDDYLIFSRSRELTMKKYKALREWIFSAISETDIPKISYDGKTIDVMESGILWRSRSEIEEEMWRLDTIPLYSSLKDENQNLTNELFLKSITGFTRAIVDKTDGNNKIRSDIMRIIYLAGFISIIAILVTFVFSSFMVRNIRILNARAIEVGNGELNVCFDIRSRDEIGQLSSTLNKMVKGLVERDKVKSALGKFVHPEIAEMILKKELALGGERTKCAILFTDIRNFTAISEKMEPEGVVEFLNAYMTKMVECVNSTNGLVDKFIGDAIMATWGAGFSRGNNAEQAINAAIMMRKALIKFNEKRGTFSKPVINIGCGINYGSVIAGQIGSIERLEYTVIGDAVNLASRIETLNKLFGTDILISQDLFDQVPGVFRVVKMQSITVKGKEKPQTIYAVLGRLTDPESPKTLEELRRMVGIKFDHTVVVDPNKKEEKFKTV